MGDCSDSLKPFLGNIGIQFRGYDWDGIVKDNVPGPYRPSSVDFILVTDDSIDFIEFKGGDICKPGILDNLRMKAVDTSLVFDRFFPSDECQSILPRNLIIVYRDHRRAVSSFQDDVSRIGRAMSRFSVRDVHGNRIYYDDVLVMSTLEFDLHMESRFSSDRAS